MTNKTNKTKKPHVHAEVIKSWADGADIQSLDEETGFWNDISTPAFLTAYRYRVKLESKKDVVLHGRLSNCSIDGFEFSRFEFYCRPQDNIKITFDGETGKLKSAEVIG